MTDYTPVLRRLHAVGLSPNLIHEFRKGAASRAASGLYLPLRSPTPRFVVEGWLMASRIVQGGQQQNVGFFLPGDIVDEFPQRDSPWDEIFTLTSATLMSVPPDFQSSAVWRTLVDSDRREKYRAVHAQVLRLGRMDSQQRLAHFILEIDDRWRMATMDTGPSIPFPLLQLQLADYLGLSAVHINRTVKSLRTLSLALVGRQLEIIDRPGLETLCGWRASDARRLPANVQA